MLDRVRTIVAGGAGAVGASLAVAAAMLPQETVQIGGLSVPVAWNPWYPVLGAGIVGILAGAWGAMRWTPLARVMLTTAGVVMLAAAVISLPISNPVVRAPRAWRSTPTGADASR